jgi:hypothetical protein
MVQPRCGLFTPHLKEDACQNQDVLDLFHAIGWGELSRHVDFASRTIRPEQARHGALRYHVAVDNWPQDD